MSGKEIRKINGELEIRSNEQGNKRLVGYALKFNRWSKVLYGEFVERLDPNCLSKTTMSDCVMLINHDENFTVGRNNVNLTLTVDEIGLRFECDLPNTTYANDLNENVASGILRECSFAFTLPKDGTGEEWNFNEDEQLYERTITNIEQLYDVSIVTNPAYKDTEAVAVAQRSFYKVKEERNSKKEIELLDMDVEVYRL